MGNTIDKSVLNQYTTTDYSTLFNSLPKTDSSSGGGLFNLATEFQSIRSGSYGKLLSAYYQKMSNEGQEEAIEKENTNRQLVAGNSSSLKSAASKLSDMDFTKATEEESLNAVKDFISSYNSVVDTADDVESRGVLRNAVWMTNMMQKSAGLLSDVGISIGENNQLTLDETKWKEASATMKSALFNGRNGLAEKLAYKADRISGAATEKASYTATAYKPNGDYNKPTTESMFEDIV